MKTIDKKDVLRERILALEVQQASEFLQIKTQFRSTMEQLTPLNLIKKAFTGLTSSPDAKLDLVDSAVDVATNFIAKNTMLGIFQKPIKRILGNVAMSVLNKISPKKELQG